MVHAEGGRATAKRQMTDHVNPVLTKSHPSFQTTALCFSFLFLAVNHQWHTYLPKNCVFRTKITTTWNTAQVLGTILHLAPPLLILCSWEYCLLITLNCLPVQSFHTSTVNLRVHTSVTFLVNSDKGNFSQYFSPNIWKPLFFTGNGLAGVQSVDSAIPSL